MKIQIKILRDSKKLNATNSLEMSQFKGINEDNPQIILKELIFNFYRVVMLMDLKKGRTISFKKSTFKDP